MKRKNSDTIKTDPFDDKKLAAKQLQANIGRRIQNIRRDSRLTARQVADGLQITRAALTLIETGRNSVNAVMLWRLAGLLGCDIGDFFPSPPKEYRLTQYDVQKISKIDPGAAEWSKVLFSKKQNHEIR